MSTNGVASARVEVEPGAGLSALQNSWTLSGVPEPAVVAPGAPPPVPAAAPRSFLDLRSVPQLDQDSTLGIFTMMTSGYPAEWKEQIRQLRTRLTAQQTEVAIQNEEMQILAVTNCRGSHSRRELAANLALTLASLRDVRVLVVDARIQYPSIPLEGPGLCEASRAPRAALPGCFRRVTGTQLYLLPLGDPTGHPLDPIDLRGLHDLFRQLRSQFDWILLDCPGMDTPSDAMALSMFADGTMLIVERERDSFESVAVALSQVQGRRLLGTVLF